MTGSDRRRLLPRGDPAMRSAAQGVSIGMLVLLCLCLAGAAVIAGCVVVWEFLGLS